LSRSVVRFDTEERRAKRVGLFRLPADEEELVAAKRNLARECLKADKRHFLHLREGGEVGSWAEQFLRLTVLNLRLAGDLHTVVVGRFRANQNAAVRFRKRNRRAFTCPREVRE